jgi:site-specific DNA-cytosine methylase
MENSKKIILDLCGGTGSWAKPYKDAGYDVRLVTLPTSNILKTLFSKEWIGFEGQEPVATKDIYGILAAPPCTMFSLARTRAKRPRDFDEGMKVVEACLNIIWNVRKQNKFSFWAMENPMGYLRQFMGKPPFTFDPWEFGDPYTKKTDIWGYFNFPKKKYKNIEEVMTREQIAKCSTNSRRLPSISELTGSKQADKRAITPQGFAQAFFKANH